LTRYVPLDTCTHGNIFNNHREVIYCICGTVLVVVARFRAAAVSKLVCGLICGCPPPQS